ncbi:AHH domain-containing protein [Methylomonas sp. CM2]|uniref:AHH domain-containing protein n=1 Tax=Methylomonas sp. CM2 TaxID=3417647 RepID=UPI003CFB2606
MVKERGETKDEGDATHHIVAWGAKRAEDSRAILAKVGMSIDDANNGLFVHGMYHDYLHTRAYHEAVYDSLRGAATYGEVADSLAGIRARIQAGTFPFKWLEHIIYENLSN